MMWKRIASVQDARQCLAQMGVEVIGIEYGWIVREADETRRGFELICDSGAELMTFAEELQARRSGHRQRAARAERTTGLGEQVRWGPKQSTHSAWFSDSAERREVAP